MTPIPGMTPEQLDRLNSATKYPSIPTYHTLTAGRLTAEVSVDFAGLPVEVTEKIDGTNARIIIPPDSAPVIGSRQELLFYLPDVIPNQAEGIVATLRDLAWELYHELRMAPNLSYTVLYGEVYGGLTGSNGRNYTADKVSGFRLFDIADIPAEVLAWDRPTIAGWRERGGQAFRSTDELILFALQQSHLLELVPFVDRMHLPTTVRGTYEWLCDTLPESLARLDHSGLGLPEGVVVRDSTRGRIAKIRFEDYERTLKEGRFAQGKRRVSVS